MKLNYKRTILVGFAFLAISAFWQMYDNIIPLILQNTFGLSQTVSGVIMAADNVFAVFLLPLFGGISDRCNAKLGKRTPFILIGTAVSVVLMQFLPYLDNSYAQQPAAWKVIGFIVTLALVLIAMGTFRSPAVALMPDVTPKPLRSKGNAVINMMGAIGGIIYLIITTFLYSKSRVAGLDHVNYWPLFLIVAGIMTVAAVIILTTIRERKLEEEMKAYEAAHPEQDLTKTTSGGNKVLPKEVKRSLGFLLCSIALWFIAYNGVTTWFSTYAKNVWHMAEGDATFCLTIATVGAIVSYIPVGAIASKVGRKKTILFGTVLLAASFFCGFLFTVFIGEFSPILYVLFALIGVAWASINVNSLPMVVEMCKESDIGKFTGYYYTFSMAAQIITPILSGALSDLLGENVLFPYAAIFAAASCVTMLFVMHGDSKPVAKKNALEQFEEDSE